MRLGTDSHKTVIVQLAHLNERNAKESYLRFDEAASIGYPMFISATTVI
jgi:hypothetical protein